MTKLLIKENIPLKNLTTFHVGGLASYFAEVNNKEELTEVVGFAKSKNIPIFILGGGSDILMSDEGFPGLVLRYKDTSISFKVVNNDVLVTAGAGLIWDGLVKVCVEKGLQGIECLSGIPGSVGASPIQNIGAYGQELKDTFVSLTAYDLRKAKFVTLDKKSCRFSYRESIFKDPQQKGRYIILGLTLRLKKDAKPSLIYESLTSYLSDKNINSPTIREVREAILTLRGRKLEDPKVIGNAGSFFKNPMVERPILTEIQKDFPEVPFHEVADRKVKLFAGWLIEKSGWKGKRYKNASVSERNALVIMNPEGRATAREVKELADKISSAVEKKFKIELEPEVQYIGF
ncbi:UDP-N-acetylenolpyruvoylglucosamine reductase [Candidatus Woesebacteria bacterium RIFCSPHIGHO2_01_FULL_39_32]|uniref:UDP-N-acetylenolpyruvoylglucosamine reductase n=1 Tax=Candidatus Woesebacteria bacterium RIFCSPLOWO2_01_FULL_39_25 TaxID=1802521 RepID=A0A1F8BLK3_9BACT|nr:MAG: UDP-N-acetylenolpyruvoylglucosamine reductase [Candidatus Woesebacteria bacterium RIFCSPHIGHO2_01_FULL_39_32]OGM38535.1 MAG: UDP-N-acetylenolpyruvoylglucosamine reductase [Candidatus Woesebacteria bacterium RIFCSPHIGHO2_12_FULL_38_11]OGM64961.1 MAG: UDP-N-acetylenolpyruvoylglucosamine reductase [Candidatus Woesebacteria bacterium RIFCSPLOWO2_01_FULL_39_25]